MRRSGAVLIVVVLAGLLAGCTSPSRPASDPPSRAPASSPTGTPTGPPPTLGGPTPVRHHVPKRAMNRLERPVAVRLAVQVAREGLTLTYLACPPWTGRVPRTMTCHGYVDGLVVPVRVVLEAAVAGRAVRFDARLGSGVLATRKLEATLRRPGTTAAYCGRTPAYPTRVGTRIVCRVVRSGRTHYVAATVTSRAGEVRITDLDAGGTSP